MASAWGQSWGQAWGVSWGDTGTTPVVETPAPIRYPGSHPYLGLRLRKLKVKQEVREVIHRVAQAQVERLETDKHKQFEELLRELELEEIEWNTRYLTALQHEREFLIEQEIGRLLRKKIQTEEEEGLIAVLMAVL